MEYAVCYLFGDETLPSLHGRIIFRSAEKHKVALDLDFSGLDEHLYGVRVGGETFAPIAGDRKGCARLSFYPETDSVREWIGSRVSVFRYESRKPEENAVHRGVAAGTVREATGGRAFYTTQSGRKEP